MILDTPFDAAAGDVVLLDWPVASDCSFAYGQLNGTTDTSGGLTCRPVRLGAPGHANRQARFCDIEHNDIAGAVCFEGWGWENCSIKDNNIILQNGTSGVGRAFKNSGSVSGGEPTRRYLQWDNFVTGGNQGCPEVDNTFGFTGGRLTGIDSDNFGNRTIPINIDVSALHQTVNPAAADRVLPATLGSAFRGYLEIVDSNGNYAKFWVPSLTGTVVELDDSSGTYTATSGNPATINFYYDGGAGYHKLQNNTGIALEFFFNLKAFPNGG